MALSLVTTLLPAKFTVLGREMTLTAIRGNEPLWTFTLPNYNFNEHLPATLTLLVKANADAPDGSAFATLQGTVIDPANGKFTIQVTTAATANPGRFFYKLMIADAGGGWCMMFGDFVVVNA